MTRSTLITFVAGLAAMILVACNKSTPVAGAIAELSVADVASLLQKNAAVVVDANGAETRREQGIVPSARLLTSSGSFDPATELPADKGTKLVFYCGNEGCHASDGAAERARSAGFSDVNVMRAGIAGWKAAGQPTVPPT